MKIYENPILYLLILIVGIGTVMMYSASSIIAMNRVDNYLHFFSQQFKWLLIGTTFMIIMYRFNYIYIRKFALIVNENYEEDRICLSLRLPPGGKTKLSNLLSASETH